MAVAVKLPAVLAPREDRDNQPKLVLVPQSDRRYLRVITTVVLIAILM